MRKRLGLAAVAAVVCLLIGALTSARPTEAQWLDREVTTAAFQAKTVPPPLLAGAAPYCTWNSVITTTALVFTWSPPAGYAASSIRITAQKGTTTQVITGATTTSSGGVYTTTVPVNLLNALGSLLGGSVVIHLQVVDPATLWLSKSVDYTWTFSLAGIAVGCSATAAG